MKPAPGRTNAHVNLVVLELGLHVARAAGALDELDRLAGVLGDELEQGREEVLAVPADTEEAWSGHFDGVVVEAES